MIRIAQYHKNAGLMAPGVHQVVIVDAAETVASTGTPQLHVTVQDKAGKTGHAYLALTDKAEFAVCQLAEAVGLAVEEGKELAFEPADLVDKACYVRVTQNGNGQLRVRQFSATAPSAPNAPATELE